jgi:SAM-dependent methyltransferase
MSGFYATIARYYDSEHYDKDEDLDFYRDLSDEYGSRVLIIGAGTGRIAVELAIYGCHVVGVDNEPAMLERARHKLDGAPADIRARLQFVQGDALKLAVEGQFQLVIIPYNTLMHFHEYEAYFGLLERCRGWVAKGGALVIDLPNAGESFAAQDTGAVTLERMFLERETGHLIMQHSVATLDRVTQMMQVTWIYDEVQADHTVKRTIAPVINRYFFYPELKLLLERAGFTVAGVHGDFDRSDYEDGCPRMLVVGV